MIAAFVSITACVPQVAKLYRMKCSDEFQLSTWAVWLMTQLVSLAYVVSIGDTILVVNNVLWVSFYLLMVVMIIAYRPKASFRLRGRQVGAVITIHDKA